MSEYVSLGYEEGETCNRAGCSGVIEEEEVEGCCSCHISPPCSYCTTPKEWCPECEWRLSDEETVLNDFLVGPIKSNGAFTHYRPRHLDPTKIDFRRRAHSNSSMIKEGVYPQSGNASKDREAVLAKVEGTFGGKFEYFGNGKFKYIAYTD